ncbi:DnaB-like helicase C-terminal domain-containing protein [Kitasatospora sp. NPDC088783]|uniref:DnaB-like helicase C-terminal domain-containing protein n=1 Tax=Kitasatospora sp. NPDC088783 TaxID=3364077 RepID=UPI00380BB942
MPAYQLTNPLRGHLATPAGRKLKAALSAAVRGRITGPHWTTLLTTPRSAFGGPTSGRAEQAYSSLEAVVTDYLQPALAAVAAAQFAAGLELAASAPSPAAADTPAPTATATPAAAAPNSEADRLAEAVHDVVEHRAILCVTGPAPTQAIATASQRQELPTVWLRPHPAKDRAGLIRAFYAGLGLDHYRPQPRALNTAVELIATELQRRPRLVIVPDAEQLPTAALQQLYSLWSTTAPDRIPLILAGQDRLHTVLARPGLASLKSCVFIWHRIPSAPAQDSTAVPPDSAAVPPSSSPLAAVASGPDLQDASVPVSSPSTPASDAQGFAQAAVSAPAPAAAAAAVASPGPVPLAAPSLVPAAASAPSAVPAAPSAGAVPAPAGEAATAVPVPVAPTTPATLHEARAALPHLIKAASSGTVTPLARGTDHAVLTAPATATGLGWDLTGADIHGTADARKKLGDLIQAAALGRPQVLRRHVTPVAVLLPATGAGVPRPPADFTTPSATDQAAVPAAAVPPVPAPFPAPAPAPAVVAEPVPASAAVPAVLAVPPAAPAPASAAAAPAAAPGPAVPAPDLAAVPPDSVVPAAVAAAPASASASAGAAPSATTAAAPAAVPSVSRRLAPFAQALDLLLTPHHPHTPDPDTATAATSDGPHPLPGLRTGLRALDEALGGLQPGRFYLVAAPPGLGSSLLAATAARLTALEHHQPVLYAASGLSRADVAARITAAHLPVDYRRLRAGRLNPTEQQDVAALQHELAAAPLYIDDGTDLTAAAIAESAEDLPGLALVVVDRFQSADDPRLPLSGPRLTDAAQALAHLARTRNLPLLAAVDTTDPDHLAALGLDITITLAPYTGRYGREGDLDARITERDFGTLATIALHADLAHARITDYTDPYEQIPAPDPDRIRAARSITSPADPDPAGTAPAIPVHNPAADPAPSTAEQPAPAAAVPGPATDPATASPGAPVVAQLPAEPHTPGAWPANLTPTGTAPAQPVAPGTTPQPAADPAAEQPPAAGAGAAAPEQPVAEGRLAPSTAEAFASTSAAARKPPTPTPANTGGGYAGRDYSYFTGMITRAVDQALVSLLSSCNNDAALTRCA